MSREPSLRLEDILEAAHFIETYIDGFDYESFIEDTRTVDAVVRNSKSSVRQSNICLRK